jgi:hypothetical protein
MSDFDKTPASRGSKLPRMKTLEKEKLAKAESFMWISARALERVRFEHVFGAGPREPVISALRAYQNSDGGIGQAIEPDFRGPVSQPLSVDFAFKVLEEIGSPDPSVIQPAIGFLQKITAPDGGLPNVLANVADYPRAPWWAAPEKVSGCLLPTASIAGLLFKWKVAHPWLDRATEYTWPAIDAILERVKSAKDRLPRLQAAYEARASLPFLDHVPDRTRAERVAKMLHEALVAAGMISHDEPAAEAGAPLDFAPHPETLARHWFDDRLIDRHLDAMIDAQQPDGGWTVPWLIWTPITGLEWRGIQTVERLKTLRAYGRIASR